MNNFTLKKKLPIFLVGIYKQQNGDYEDLRFYRYVKIRVKHSTGLVFK